MGVLLQGFFFAPGRVAGVPSPFDGDATVPFWWDHLAAQAQALAKSGFTAIWLPPLKGASGSFSSGYDLFDDYDLGSKKQKGTIPTRYGTREQLQRCAAMMRANGIDVYVDLVEVSLGKGACRAAFLVFRLTAKPQTLESFERRLRFLGMPTSLSSKEYCEHTTPPS
jgi:hypothetical protein